MGDVVGRTSREEQLALALDELAHLGVVRIDEAPDGKVLVQGRGRPWPARVYAYDIVGEPLAREVFSRGRRNGPGIIVANQISEPARRFLEGKRWSWLDRRVGAHIADLDRDVEVRYSGRAPEPRPIGAPDSPIRGRAGVSYAAALLMEPTHPPSMRSVAAAVDMSPQSVSNAARLLAEAGLIGIDRRPTVPDLFWALAAVWRPVRTAGVATAPPPRDGWVLGGDGAAVALGAPVVALDERPWIWVPTVVDLRRAERSLGTGDAATLAVPPTPLVITTAWQGFTHPLFVALDLGRDPGRGREVLDRWQPDGVDVVWR